jgi:surface antigen
MRRDIIILLFGAGVLATGCATKRETGTAVGAVGGALVGQAVGGNVGMILGAAAGGALGYTIGSEMDEQDRRQLAYALEADRPSSWENPQTGYEYQVVPEPSYYQRGRECREFRLLAEVNGSPDEIHGRACRAPDGRWEAI